jgi:AcrR family transcriptional regulator
MLEVEDAKDGLAREERRREGRSFEALERAMTIREGEPPERAHTPDRQRSDEDDDEQATPQKKACRRARSSQKVHELELEPVESRGGRRAFFGREQRLGYRAGAKDEASRDGRRHERRDGGSRRREDERPTGGRRGRFRQNMRLSSHLTEYEGPLIFCQVKPSTKPGADATRRRVPTQERGKRRVDEILDAAAIVFAELGFEAATTEAIARKASTSIGSLYLFFPNKLALFEALAERSLERSRVVFEALFPSDSAGAAWAEVLDTMIDGFATLHRTDPAFRALLLNFQLYGLYAHADTKMHRYIVDRVAAKIAAQAPHLSKAKSKIVASTVVNTIASLLYLSQREKPARAKEMLHETKVVARRYIEGYLGLHG